MPQHNDPSAVMRALPGLPPGVRIAGLTCDSRKVSKGFLFAALPGNTADGRAFIGKAIDQGAGVILAPEGTTLPEGSDACLITDPNPRRRFSLLAAEFHDRQPAVIAAVTGTNGKTSTADFTRQMWTALGFQSASVGTLGIIAPGWDNKGGLTTPDPESLHAALARLAGNGVDHACLEASSHGLTQFRLDGVRIKYGAFTNLTRDHLDYHGDMESYAQAKLRLFSDLLPADGTAVINADSPDAQRFIDAATKRGLAVLTYGAQGRDLVLTKAIPQAQGQHLALSILGRAFEINLPLAGTFQAGNVLAALGLVIASGAEPDRAVATLGTLVGVPGRLQKVAVRASGAAVYVDYAHTPDALETVLNALRPHIAGTGRLVCLFGCGGDRDPGKRPMMGAIAARLADRVYVTDDNPRSENPGLIRRSILAACPDAIEIGERGRAIREAINDLRQGDVLVLAGKGHERGQIVGATTLPFDDAEEARRAVAEIDGGRP